MRPDQQRADECDPGRDQQQLLDQSGAVVAMRRDGRPAPGGGVHVEHRSGKRQQGQPGDRPAV
ncbi:hypothetical protein [Actinoplanes sp. NPDC020271]|uniref:hypothetical protein n=1 Tax=Actinoplanes sp. NPDC020271 TaxID=3363896 RepID=UPI0037B32286